MLCFVGLIRGSFNKQYKVNFAIKSFLAEIKVYFFYSFFGVILLHCHTFLPSVYQFLYTFSVEFFRLIFKPIAQKVFYPLPLAAAADLEVTKIFINDFMCCPNKDIQNVCKIFHFHPSVRIMSSSDLIMVGVFAPVDLPGLFMENIFPSFFE